ncbi:hypothetical protein GWI33_015107 [Rhynchophorus ferrugineus]|uniref:Uncharacterized protein n=1 Tax=Rhynchophorus ferrugineus TaxID=354439 RepID=A0A834I0C8_RHYFE|nr:hypothetical protein GWI33_015107 [Rhynchophorus ferrugineus]
MFAALGSRRKSLSHPRQGKYLPSAPYTLRRRRPPSPMVDRSSSSWHSSAEGRGCTSVSNYPITWAQWGHRQGTAPVLLLLTFVAPGASSARTPPRTTPRAATPVAQ